MDGRGHLPQLPASSGPGACARPWQCRRRCRAAPGSRPRPPGAVPAPPSAVAVAVAGRWPQWVRAAPPRAPGARAQARAAGRTPQRPRWWTAAASGGRGTAGPRRRGPAVGTHPRGPHLGGRAGAPAGSCPGRGRPPRGCCASGQTPTVSTGRAGPRPPRSSTRTPGTDTGLLGAGPELASPSPRTGLGDSSAAAQPRGSGAEYPPANREVRV